MQIKTRLSLLFLLITATILLAFASVIYLSAKKNREEEFYSLLKKEAITKANLFLNAQVEIKTLQGIYKNNREILNEVEVAVYDTTFQLLYHDAVDIDFVKETLEMIQEIQRSGEKRFYQADWQVVGISYVFKKEKFIIIAAAYDQYGYNKLTNLFKTIIIVFIISILVILAAGLYFSQKALLPIQEITKKVKVISATRLDLRLHTADGKDELSELADTFNNMLERLEKSFDAQKLFVSNISHELRTPLAAIITELELTIHKERNVEEYKTTIHNVLSDAKKIVRLSNSLLDLAKANYDSAEISFKPTRIDELLLDARHQVIQANADYKVDIYFEDIQDEDNEMILHANEYLLQIAFMNLIENGCKFSDAKRCSIAITRELTTIKIQFSDSGIGIPEDNLKYLFTPFYRGSNTYFADGNGIGLSLTSKIIQLHQGTITVHTKQGIGSTFTVELPSF